MTRAIRAINALEGRIVQAEDDADAMLWRQAAHVVKQLEAGLTHRELAAQWINVRTGKPYNQSHVGFVKQAFLTSALVKPRPRFRDAYNAVANPKPPPREPEPFHWINAVGDLVETVETMIQAWPEAARQLAPKALRDLAESLEVELGGIRDVGRRDRTETTSTDTDPVVMHGVGAPS